MPLPFTPVPLFPNVPFAPGVPPLPGPIQAQNNIVLVSADVYSAIQRFLPIQWGLFTQSGAPAFSLLPGLTGAAASAVSAAIQLIGGGGQSVGEVEFRLDHRISTAPQEQGAFLSYNKVSTPFQGKVAYNVSGITAAQRGLFLSNVLQMQQSLTLLSLVMPEYTYPSCNVVHHDFRRDARRGVSMFVVDVWVEEIRVSGTAAYSNTQNPASANPVNGGTVQPQTPTPAQTTAGAPSGLG